MTVIAVFVGALIASLYFFSKRDLAPQEIQPADLAKPLRKGEWRLFVDLLGPPVTVVNVSGIGARARQASASLSADLEALG
jgi:hypothetical protein